MTTITSGYPGVEVPHQWAAGVVLNDLSLRPRTRLTRLTGFHSSAPSDPQSIPNAGRSGEYPLQTFTGAKDVVYEGLIEARTLDQMRFTGNALRSAFRDKNSIKQMRMLGAVVWGFNARCIQYDSDDEQTTSSQSLWPYSRNFTIGFRLYDKRVYAVNDQVSVTGVSSGSSTSVTNLGNSDALPTFTIPVASSGAPLLQNLTTGKRLKFKALPSSGTLLVDFNTQAASIGGVDMSGYVDLTDCTWWDDDCDGIPPGANSVKVTGASAAWAVSFYPASE